MIISKEIEDLRDDLDRIIDRVELLDIEMHDRKHGQGTTAEEMLSLVQTEVRRREIMQKDIAEGLGMNRSTVSLYLRGKRKPSFDFLIGTLGMLGYKVEVLPMALPFEPEGAEIEED